MDNGYWVKFESWRIEPNIRVPHGIRYSVTLHDRHNRRVLGFDNSHGFTPQRKCFGGRKTTWDHRHRRDEVAQYEFESPGQLLEDFWREAERMMAEEE